jgi:hypothetical protein
VSAVPLPVRPPRPGAPRSGPADIVYVLCLLQAASVLLAGFGEALLMGGNGAYVLLPMVKTAVLVWLATKAVSMRRWAIVTLIVLQSITLAGFVAQLVIALVPALALTVNLVGLTMNVALPIGVIVLCGRTLRQRRAAIAAMTTPAPTVVLYPAQDPFAPAPIIDPTTADRLIEQNEAAAVPAVDPSRGSMS